MLLCSSRMMPSSSAQRAARSAANSRCMSARLRAVASSRSNCSSCVAASSRASFRRACAACVAACLPSEQLPKSP